MGNTIKVAAEIRINDLPMSRVDQLVDALYSIQCAAVRPIGILFLRQVGLKDWFAYPPRLLPGGANQFPGGSCTRCSPAPFTAHCFANDSRVISHASGAQIILDPPPPSRVESSLLISKFQTATKGGRDAKFAVDGWSCSGRDRCLVHWTASGTSAK